MIAHELGRRFFVTGAPCGPPALVPASAWLEGAGADLQIQEHSVGIPALDAVVTMLWDASESAERPPDATLQTVAVFRDHLLGELEANLDPKLAPLAM